MRNRIARTIIGVVALVIVVLGVPFAIVLQRFYESRATAELERSAAQAIAELALPLDPVEIAAAAQEPDAPPNFSVYDAAGDRLFGSGPARADDRRRDELVVVSPITDRSSETIVGSVRVARPLSDIASEARRAWALMGLAAVAALILAWVVARREAARLVAPISELAAAAERLGSGEFDAPLAVSGVPELDTVAAALSMSGHRLAELVAREREFSANASHQLRTPLAGLQLSLERGDLAAAQVEVERLSVTVDHMLAVARDALPMPELIDLAPVVAASAARWNTAYRQAGRTLVATIDDRLPEVRARTGSIEQAIDVLLDNALRHGDGEARIAARSIHGGAAIQVDDDGPGVDPTRVESIFQRHEGIDTGIGLALARTLVEADGGRLLLIDPDAATFRIVLLAARPSPDLPDTDRKAH